MEKPVNFELTGRGQETTLTDFDPSMRSSFHEIIPFHKTCLLFKYCSYDSLVNAGCKGLLEMK